MKRKIQLYESLGMSAAILLFCVIGAVVGVVPMIQKIYDNVTALATLTADYNALQKKLTLLSSMDESTLRDDLANALSAVPGDQSIPTMFSTVEALAAQTGVTVSTMQTEGGSIATSSAGKASSLETQLGTRVVPFSVTITGSFDAVEQFIAKAPTIRRLLRIRTFSISFPHDNANISVALAMDAFYEPFPTTIGSANSQIIPLTADEEDTMTKIRALTLVTDQAAVSLPPPQIGKIKDDPFSL